MSKFPDETCEALWDLTLDGAHDDECGDSSFDRWHGLCLNRARDRRRDGGRRRLSLTAVILE